MTNPEQLSKDKLRDIAETITATPKYTKRKSPPRKWSAQMDEFLDKILADDDKKCELLHTKKQRLRNNQILQLLHDEGFDIGYTTLCKKIKEKRSTTQEAFIAQHYRFGQRFEYDFGEVHLYIAGKYRRCYIAVMCAPASNYRFARIYLTQKFDVFIDSQVRFFEHMGGCFEEGVYDNMRNVVKKFIGKNEKELNDGLVKLSLYYGFEINVTNCFSGNEKGSVERSVEIVRNAAFSANWEFDSLEDAQAHQSLKTCSEKSALGRATGCVTKCATECAPQKTLKAAPQTNLSDHIAAQTQKQIALIGAIGCGVA